MDHTLDHVAMKNRPLKKSIWRVLMVWVDNVLRRILDITFSIFGIIFLSPFLFLIIMMIKTDSPGPVFYKGARVGKNGKVFKIIKFRTMYEDPKSYAGTRVTAQDDPRITPVGKFLRDTKLNELPQLLNVLIGEMSMVGPRPEDPEIVKGWPDEDRKVILSVHPGITSPASVLYRNEETMLQSRNIMDRYLWDILPSKLRLDQLYVRNRNVLSDFDVIFWTAVALLPKAKNYQVPEHLLYRGPLSVLVNRYVTWFVLDFLVALVAITISGVLRRLSAPLDLGVETAAAIALMIALLFSLVNSLMGINKTSWSRATANEALDLAISTVIVTSLLFVVNFVLKNGPILPPLVLVTTGMLAFIGFMVIRYRERLISYVATRWLNLRHTSIDLLTEPVLVVGGGEMARFAIWLMRYGPLAQAFNLVGIVDDDPKKIGSRLDGLEVIGFTLEIPQMIEKYDVGLVLFAIYEIAPSETERILTLCKNKKIRVIMIPDVMDSLRAYFPTNKTERDELAGKVVANSTMDRLTGVFNRQSFLRLVERELPRSQRYGHICSLIVFAVTINWPSGVHGSHALSMQVLRVIVERVSKNIREIDMFGRYDENTFSLLLPETDLEAANHVAERLHKNLCCTPIYTECGALAVDVVFGVVSQNENSLDAALLLTEAENAIKMSTLFPQSKPEESQIQT